MNTALAHSFPNFEPIVPHPFLTVASWPAYRFLRRKVRWFGEPNSLEEFSIHTVKRFCIVNEPEVDVFLEQACFLYDPVNAGNLISSSSAFSKSSLYIWKFSVHVLLKSSLKDFMHNFASTGFPGGSASKESTCNAGDLGSILGFGRSPGEGNSYTLQYSSLKNSRDCIVMELQTARYDWATFTLLAWGMGAIVK